MGGSGSTRWEGVATRSCVESCFTVAAPSGALTQGQRVRAWWPRRGVELHFEVSVGGPSPVLALWHAYEGGGFGHVALQSTPAHFGGRRWWFTCPACRARVRTLHMRGGARAVLGFRCRRCHDLTYESAQTSRSFWSVFYHEHARRAGVSYAFMRDHLRRDMGGVVHAARRLYFEEARS